MKRTAYTTQPIDGAVVLGMQRLLEEGEEFMNLCGWNVWVEAGRYSGFARWVLGLTEERLYAAVNGSQSKAKFEVADHWARLFSTFTEWNVIKEKDPKGRLLGYRFVVAPGVGLSGGEFTAPPGPAEPFIELLQSAISRHQAIQSTTDLAGQISAMHQLWSEGVLSESEYNRAKELFIGRPPDNQAKAESNLRSLKQLKDSGVLSEAEFAAKKWEILSQ